MIHSYNWELKPYTLLPYDFPSIHKFKPIDFAIQSTHNSFAAVIVYCGADDKNHFER